MSLPHLLLVDDSEAVLAFQRAALSGHYVVTTAADNGKQYRAQFNNTCGSANSTAATLTVNALPICSLTGADAVCANSINTLYSGPAGLTVATEKQRAEACVKNGAKAYLPKPIRAQDLLPLVGRVLEDERRATLQGSLSALFVSAGQIEIGLPLDSVLSVLHQAATRPLPIGPSYLCEMLDLHGEPVLVLDLAKRLGQEHARPIEERKLVVIDCQGAPFAVCVDAVRDPEEISRERLSRRARGAPVSRRGLLP